MYRNITALVYVSTCFCTNQLMNESTDTLDTSKYHSPELDARLRRSLCIWQTRTVVEILRLFGL